MNSGRDACQAIRTCQVSSSKEPLFAHPNYISKPFMIDSSFPSRFTVE